MANQRVDKQRRRRNALIGLGILAGIVFLSWLTWWLTIASNDEYQIERLVQRTAEYLNEGDVEGLASCLSPMATAHDQATLAVESFRSIVTGRLKTPLEVSSISVYGDRASATVSYEVLIGLGRRFRASEIEVSFIKVGNVWLIASEETRKDLRF